MIQSLRVGILLLTLFIFMLAVACVSPTPAVGLPPLDTSNDYQLFFSVKDDIALGQKTAAEIDGNPKEYPILDPAAYPEAYAYIQKIVNTLLGSGQVRYAKQFPWRVRIINRDILNAFCAPGGYIYVYTGLIRYLDAEYELAGVMGHEMAHADRRHTSRQLERTYGLALISQLALGNSSSALATQVSQIAQGLAGLNFSRAHEREADEWSVRYLCSTSYPAFGASLFFEKLQKEKSGGQSVPQFLSTHPDPGNRVQEIRKKATRFGCQGSQTYQAEYAAFKAKLPPTPAEPKQ
jgi:beta-barrel assembly-enhancing protease